MKDLIIIGALGLGAYYLISKAAATTATTATTTAAATTAAATVAASANASQANEVASLFSFLTGAFSNSGSTNATAGASPVGQANNNTAGGQPGGTGLDLGTSYYDSYNPNDYGAVYA